MTPPVILTIAGSDSSGGAGIQADLKAIAANGGYGATAITALTAQNTAEVRAVYPSSPESVQDQIEAVLDDMPVRAIKIGMLAEAGIVAMVAACLARVPAIPVVLDPVLVSSSGRALLAAEALQLFRRELMPKATLMTPNLPELAALLEVPEPRSPDEILTLGSDLLALGAQALLIKGGHGAGAVLTDFLLTEQAMVRFDAPRQESCNLHGTGCTLSAAIATCLARGMALPDAVARSHAYLQRAIAAGAGQSYGAGAGPVDHFYSIAIEGADV
ncbi:bifunctional hydroxymethylpyrimidine kinase/phosphomethylpyrimidine kinase [Aestuariispira insulae]|uniref:hydroxymethylpyrimidine kinase n=1 Tax=Aestuariispira insulae TaxID=1461337 RepID=A0A3D9HGH3_9PROT|nr:bifunctional hydroxymethylpyrimidine kinase/phosphomethylpyrimidine kinase [Aestuariispira insulae]RED48588.1 hydroxymethylpyrimidine kinase /phosphomethylpyrimidine kinase [Aestuariispira insulae]